MPEEEPKTDEKPAEDGDKEPAAEGEAAAAPESMEAKLKLY